MEIFAGVPEKKPVEITPTLNQSESAFLHKESQQNEKYTSILRQKLDIIIRRLKELNKIEEDEFDDEETEKLIEKIEQMEHEEDVDPKQACYEKAQDQEDGNESVDSFDSKYKDTKLGVFEVNEEDIQGEYLPKLRKRNDMTVVPVESIMRGRAAPNERLETIGYNLTAELRGKDDTERMYEVMQHLGMCKPDKDGSAVFKPGFFDV